MKNSLRDPLPPRGETVHNDRDDHHFEGNPKFTDNEHYLRPYTEYHRQLGYHPQTLAAADQFLNTLVAYEELDEVIAGEAAEMVEEWDTDGRMQELRRFLKGVPTGLAFATVVSEAAMAPPVQGWHDLPASMRILMLIMAFNDPSFDPMQDNPVEPRLEE